jgi:hypothetical protein
VGGREWFGVVAGVVFFGHGLPEGGGMERIEVVVRECGYVREESSWWCCGSVGRLTNWSWEAAGVDDDVWIGIGAI